MNSVWTEIEQLREAPIAHVRARYREVFQEETRSKHREHLFRRLAWRLQSLSQGGLTQLALRRADEIAAARRFLRLREEFYERFTSAF